MTALNDDIGYVRRPWRAMREAGEACLVGFLTSVSHVLSHCVFAGEENHGWRSGCIRYLLAVYDMSVVMQYFFSINGKNRLELTFRGC